MDAILLSPNGQRWQVVVDNTGAVTTKALVNLPVLVSDSSGAVWELGVTTAGQLFTTKTTIVTQ